MRYKNGSLAREIEQLRTDLGRVESKRKELIRLLATRPSRKQLRIDQRLKKIKPDQVRKSLAETADLEADLEDAIAEKETTEGALKALLDVWKAEESKRIAEIIRQRAQTEKAMMKKLVEVGNTFLAELEVYRGFLGETIDKKLPVPDGKLRQIVEVQRKVTNVIHPPERTDYQKVFAQARKHLDEADSPEAWRKQDEEQRQKRRRRRGNNNTKETRIILE